MKDIFISYTSADQAWADWLAWVLEENGYTVRLRPWDFSLDGNLILNLHMAASPGEQQFLVVLSKRYLELQSPIGGWPEEFEGQLSEAGFKLLSVLVEDCQPGGILADLPQLSLVDITEAEAVQALTDFLAASVQASPAFQQKLSTQQTQVLQVGTALSRATAFSATLSTKELAVQDEDYEYRDQLKLRRRTETVQGYRERLTDDLSIEMMQIPAGRFVMGSPEDEPERNSNEGPQHEVQVPGFFMGKYPVTQAEWRWVAENVPQVNRDLEANPSNFKGDRHPVERVSWYDAVEFCDRLSLHTGRTYRLPSEAQWEYACRAGTTTPFHFGETITTTVANYDGTDAPDGNLSGSYGRGPKGESRESTTPVDYFGITNAFGLCDMHGNISEWCLDQFHHGYKDAPTDGSAWIDEEVEGNRARVIRGGSWYNFPTHCRCASRFPLPRASNDGVGFRLACVAVSANQKKLRNNTSIPKAADLRTDLLQFLNLACQEGLRDRAIAQELQITEQDVRTYWEEIYEILEIDADAERASERNLRVTCCIRARQRGLID